MKRQLIKILFILISISATAQVKQKFEFSGKVYLAIDSTVLRNVFVIPNNLPQHGAVSDSLGNFTLLNLNSGTHELEFRAFGYERNNWVFEISDRSINNMEFYLLANCDYDKEQAKLDVLNNSPKLLLSGGIAPVIYFTDSKFERKYKIDFIDFGCTPEAYECMVGYNSEIFKFLDKKYGLKWRKSVRKDVIGLK